MLDAVDAQDPGNGARERRRVYPRTRVSPGLGRDRIYVLRSAIGGPRCRTQPNLGAAAMDSAHDSGCVGVSEVLVGGIDMRRDVEVGPLVAVDMRGQHRIERAAQTGRYTSGAARAAHDAALQ